MRLLSAPIQFPVSVWRRSGRLPFYLSWLNRHCLLSATRSDEHNERWPTKSDRSCILQLLICPPFTWREPNNWGAQNIMHCQSWVLPEPASTRRRRVIAALIDGRMTDRDRWRLEQLVVVVVVVVTVRLLFTLQCAKSKQISASKARTYI